VSYYVRSIDHNIPAGRVFEIVNYWQILLVNPPLPDFGRSEAEGIDRTRYHLAQLPSNCFVVKTWVIIKLAWTWVLTTNVIIIIWPDLMWYQIR